MDGCKNLLAPRAKGKPRFWGVILAVSGSCCIDGILHLLGVLTKPISWGRQGPPIPLSFAQSCRNHFIAISREPSSLRSQVWRSLWLVARAAKTPELWGGKTWTVPRAICFQPNSQGRKKGLWVLYISQELVFQSKRT